MDSGLTLLLSEDEAAPERLDQLTGYLRRELLQLDVEDVRALPAGPPPPGSRALDIAAVGGLVIGLAKSGPVLRSVVSAVQSWLHRGSGGVRTVRLELDGDVLVLSGASPDEQARVVDLFIERHSGIGEPAAGTGARDEPGSGS